MSKCNFCNKEESFFWQQASGRKLKLCLDHYEAMEREVHQREKTKRLVNTALSVINAEEMKTNYEPCPNGKDCKYCKEIGINY